MNLSYSSASERNKDAILEILKNVFREVREVLEIGSGTGQHAVYFGRNLPHLTWIPADLPENLAGIQARLEAENPGNVQPPLTLDVQTQPWPIETADAIFSANVTHIMSWECIKHFFRGVGKTLETSGTLCLYGPFNYNGEYTSDSNAHFDLSLKSRDPLSGIRDFEKVDRLAKEQGLSLLRDVPMPANNRMLIWKRDRY